MGLQNEAGQTATISISPNIKREAKWKDGVRTKKWTSDRVLVVTPRGTYRFVSPDNASELVADGKVNIVPPQAPILIQNKRNQYTFVSAELAEELDSSGKAMVLNKTEPEYVQAYKMAQGKAKADGAKSLGDTIQRGGKLITSAAIGMFDSDADIRRMEQEVADLKGLKEDEIAEELPTPDSFESKRIGKFRGKRE